VKKYLWLYAVACPIIFLMTAFVLGLITPGYDHLRDTISTLAVIKYGVIQQINFVQFGIGVVIGGWLVYRQFVTDYAKTVWKRIIYFCLAFVITETIFPTDLITGTPITQVNLTYMGKIHLTALAIFFLLAPLGVYTMQKALSNEPRFLHLIKFTALSGYTGSILCYVWTYFFIMGYFYPYLGIMQKIIGLITFPWLVALIYSAKPSYGYKN
jgi:hypothetical protein